MKKNIKRLFLYLLLSTLLYSGVPVSIASAADISLRNWKVTLPICDGGEAKEIKQPALDQYISAGGSEWFKKTAEGLDFYVNSKGACTTGGSENPRSELREMNSDGSNEYNWSPRSGTHRMIVRQKVTELSVQGEGAGVVIGQIHEYENKDIDDYTVFRVEGKTLYAFVDGKKSSSKVIDSNFPLNQEVTVGFSVENGSVKFLYDRNGGAQPPEVHSVAYPSGGKAAYFKAGNYCQCGKEGRSGTTRVVITGLGVSHDGSYPDLGGASSGNSDNASGSSGFCDPSKYDEAFFTSNDILFYCPGATTCKEGSGSSLLQGEDNFEKIWNFFINKGLTPEATAGILGNIKVESGGDPENIQNPGGRTQDPSSITSGWGLIQWTPGKKVLTIAKEAGITGPIHELATQLDIVWWHMNNKSPTGVTNMLTDYKSLTDIAQATKDYEEKMEGAGTPNIENRIAFAQEFFEKYKGNTSSTPSSEAGGCSSDLGVGKGDFTDSGEVSDYSTILANAQYSDKNYNDRFYQKGVCAAITSVVWHGGLVTYGKAWAIELWESYGSSNGHADRSPKKGALLLYSSTQEPPGHVVIYLGNNKILNDGKIVDANIPEEQWGLDYKGWIDPNEIGWNTKPIGNLSSDEVRDWIKQHVPSAKI